MLPAQPKYSFGARRAVPRCAQPLLRRVLLATGLTSRGKAHPGSAPGGKWGTGNDGAQSPSGTSCKAAEKKGRREFGVSRMREKMGKQGLRGCKHNATTLFVLVLYFVLI